MVNNSEIVLNESDTVFMSSVKETNSTSFRSSLETGDKFITARSNGNELLIAKDKIISVNFIYQ